MEATADILKKIRNLKRVEMNLFDLENKVILVTGGCGVLGGGIAKYLLENNAIVILLHYKEEPLLSTVNELKKISKKVEGYVCNVVEEDSLQEVAKKIINTYGRIDALINAAVMLIFFLKACQIRVVIRGDG